MIFSFLKSRSNEMLLIMTLMLLFLIIFLSFSLPMEAYFLSLSIVLFVMTIYWGIALVYFRKETKVKNELEAVRTEIAQMKDQHAEYQDEMESYFLLWVHQMKTPITASRLILDRPEDIDVQQLRQEILQIDNYTNLALSYLKLMNTTTDMTFSLVSIDDLVKPLLKKHAIQFIHNNTKLHYETHEDMVLTDSRWASIMIEQLLNNALKYAKGKEVWIEFDSREKLLKITDTGIGIASSDIPKIFDKGYSGFNGRLNDKSTGIGLYISKSISQRLGHPINVKSTLNKGSVFSIQFSFTEENH